MDKRAEAVIATLAEPYSAALRQAIAYLHEQYSPTGIVASGTIIRGAAHASSDLDMVVLHEPAWRQRTQRFFNGVPTEMFVNPSYRIRDGMMMESSAGRPVLAHMLGTGLVIHDTAGVMAEIQEEARTSLEAGPRVSAASMNQRRYAIATAFEDAVDLRGIDEDRAQSLITDTLVEAVNWHFLNRGMWMPRSKALLTDLDALDPDLGQLVRSALRIESLEARLEIAQTLVQRLVGATGFFEWESEREIIPPKG